MGEERSIFVDNLCANLDGTKYSPRESLTRESNVTNSKEVGRWDWANHAAGLNCNRKCLVFTRLAFGRFQPHHRALIRR